MCSCDLEHNVALEHTNPDLYKEEGTTSFQAGLVLKILFFPLQRNKVNFKKLFTFPFYRFTFSNLYIYVWKVKITPIKTQSPLFLFFLIETLQKTQFQNQI